MQQPTALPAPTSFGQAILASLTSAFALVFAAIPRIIGFIVIIAIGWFVASLLAKGVSTLLRAIRFNDVAQRSGFSDAAKRMGVRGDPAGLLTGVTRWFVRLIVLVVAFDALGIPAVSGVLQQLLLWIPNFVVAMVVLVLGGLAARVGGDIVRGATASAGFARPELMASIARGTIVTFAVIMALSELNVAPVVINSLVIAVLGGTALAAGLAFGLGGRNQAKRMLESWADTGQRSRPRLERAAPAPSQQAAQRPETTHMWVERASGDRRRMARN